MFVIWFVFSRYKDTNRRDEPKRGKNANVEISSG